MKILVLKAHPKDGSLTNSITEKFVKSLDKKHSVTVVDVCKLKIPFYELDGNLPKVVLEQQKLIRDSELIVLIHPIWWMGMPAVLKNYIDAVFTSGFAFKYDGKKYTKLLTGKKSAIITTSGAPTAVLKMVFGIHHFITKNFILRFCGLKVIKGMNLGKAYDSMPKEKVTAFLKRVEDFAKSL